MGLDALIKYEDTYVQLKEEFTHEKNIQLEIAMDWHDLNKILNNIFSHKATSEEIYLQTRANKIIKIFKTLLTQ